MIPNGKFELTQLKIKDQKWPIHGKCNPICPIFNISLKDNWHKPNYSIYACS